MKSKRETSQIKRLSDLVREAHKLGLKLDVRLDPQEMPQRFASDPEAVKMLVAESERVSAVGNKWLSAKVPNQIAAENCLRMGWAYSLAAAWLRCALQGEISSPTPKSPKK